MKVHNRFGGMRDFAIFCGDTRDASLKQGREAGISITSGGKGGGGKGKAVGYGNSVLS